MRNFLTRSLVAVVGIPALLWIFHEGNRWLLGFVVLIGILGCYEVWEVSRSKGFPVVLAWLVPLTLSIPVLLWPVDFMTWPLWITAALTVTAILAVFRRSATTAVLTLMIHLTVAVWLGFGLAAILALRGEGQGYWWLIFLFANLWIGDTAAYLGGVSIGGPKLSPVISPHKTISGSLTQIAASALVGAVFAYGDWLIAPSGMLVAGAIVIGIVGQLGDLFESALKRAAGVKDFSSIIPGHGGVLDRFDSALFAAPALWILIRLWP